MGIFEKVLQEQQPETLTLTREQAFAAIIVAAATADGNVGATEAARLEQLFASTRLFRPPAAPLQTLIGDVMRLVQQYGTDTVMQLAATALPAPLRAPAFATAVDVVLADGQAGAEERKCIDALQALLRIDDALAMKIVEVMLIRNSV